MRESAHLYRESAGLQNYMREDTGEMVRLLPLASEPTTPKRKYLHPGGYAVMGLINITRLIKMQLPADGYRLALSIAARSVSATCLCHCANQEFADELGISKARVSALIGRLVKSALIYRVGPHCVMTNPSWCFKGTPTQHHEAVAAWQALHPLGIVKPLRKAS